MRNVYQVMEEYGEKLNEFKSPLAGDWEVVLFKAIDILHNLQNEFRIDTQPVKRLLLPIIISNKYDGDALNKAINLVRDIMDEGNYNRFVQKSLEEILDLLFAVKVTMSSKDDRL